MLRPLARPGRLLLGLGSAALVAGAVAAGCFSSGGRGGGSTAAAVTSTTPASPSAPPPAPPPPPVAVVTITDTGPTVRLEAQELGLVVTKRPLRVELLRASAPVTDGAPIQYRAGGRWHACRAVTAWSSPTPTSARFELETSEPGRAATLVVDVRAPWQARVEVTFADPRGVSEVADAWSAAPDEALYGGGERFNRVEMRGETASLWALHQHGWKYLPAQLRGQTDNCPVPVVLSNRGWAATWDTTARGTLEFPRRGQAAPVILRVEDDRLALDLVVADDPLDLVGRTAGVHGRPRLPPAWFFQPVTWRDDSTTLGRPATDVLLDDAQRMRAARIPLGSIWLDNPWCTGFGDFTFRPRQHPDPDKLVRDLGAQGVKLVTWASPYLAPGTQALVEARARGFDVPGARGDFGDQVDLTSPAAMAWWQARLEPVLRRGVRGVKADRGEENVLGDRARYANGQPDRLNHNLYPRLWARAVSETVRRVHGDDGVSIGRCGGTGAWADWTALWTGDNIGWTADPKGMRGDVRAHITASLSGYAFVGGDAGGYIGVAGLLPGPGTLLRWVGFAALTPMMEVGGAGPHTPWEVEARLPGATAAYRRFATLHVELFPYFQLLSREAVATGRPLVRALWLLDRKDPSLSTIDDAYTLGDALLVAPVFDDAGRTVGRTVPVPRGTWIDWWTGERVVGPQRPLRDTPLDEVPLYVKAGVPVPVLFRDGGVLGLGPDDLDRPDRLGLVLAPDLTAPTTTRTLHDGTRVDVEPAPGVVRVAITSPATAPARIVGLKLYGPPPRALRVNGQPLAQRPTADLQANDGWSWEALRLGGSTLVRVAAGAAPLVVEVEP